MSFSFLSWENENFVKKNSTSLPESMAVTGFNNKFVKLPVPLSFCYWEQVTL